MPLSVQPYGDKSFAMIEGRRMAYIDTGLGEAIVFQHGNPTSSYLWRNVMPYCEGLGRLVELAAADPDRGGACRRGRGGRLAASPIPKLLISADPGSILVGRQREVCRAWPNQSEVTVKGLHFIQEDSPDAIGRAVADFVRRVRPT